MFDFSYSTLLFVLCTTFCLLRPLVKGVTAATAYVWTGRTVEVSE